MSVQSNTGVAPAVRSPLWILSGVRDLLLFVGTPALILPVVLIAEHYFPANNLYLLVAAFGALGHHLPGMMRAYGDRALFQRFKTRFILSPIVLVGTCFAFAAIDPELYAITLMAYGWGVWHGLMQTHGFLRIYDAKVGSLARRTARLDQWMCITWFGAGILFAQSRVHYILEAFYYAGGPLVPVAAIETARMVWGALTGVVTLAFLANLVQCWRTGHSPSPVKLLLLVSTISFWLYACLGVKNLLVGIILFELFHDVQYLSIVWLFNRKRATTHPEQVGRATRMIFGRGQSLAFLYVGLVMAYGSLYFVELLLGRFNPVGAAGDSTPLYGAILAASGLLHFYYDGFIWKVKEKGTRESLGLAGGQEVAAPKLGWIQRSWHGIPGWAAHPLKWAPFAAVVAIFLYTHAHTSMTETQARLELGAAFPNYDLAQSNLAIALYKVGDLDGAVAANRRALELRPHDEVIEQTSVNNLGWALVELAEKRLRQGDMAGAEPLLREAIMLDPSFPEQLNNQGAACANRGQLANAILKYRTALEMDPNHARIRLNLALALAQTGDVDAALVHARTSQRQLRDPQVAELIQRLEAGRTASASP